MRRLLRGRVGGKARQRRGREVPGAAARPVGGPREAAASATSRARLPGKDPVCAANETLETRLETKV